MIHRPLVKHEQVIVGLVFGLPFVYLAYRAMAGQLYVPRKFGIGGLEIIGSAAWLPALAVLLLYAGVLVRHGHLLALRPSVRHVVEFSFFIAGIAVFVAGLKLGQPVA